MYAGKLVFAQAMDLPRATRSARACRFVRVLRQNDCASQVNGVGALLASLRQRVNEQPRFPPTAGDTGRFAAPSTDSHCIDSRSGRSRMEYRAALPRACVVAGACAALMMSVSSDAPAAVGRTAGQAGVSASGAAQYTIPIWTPPGTNGLQPRLALSYSSLAGDGLAGIGVALTGLSMISRCNQTIAQGGAAYGVALSTADALCLDGLQLKLTSGTQGVAGDRKSVV